MSNPSRTNKSACFREFKPRANFTNPQTALDCSYDDLPLGSERCDASKRAGAKGKMSHKQGRANNKKAAAYAASVAMHHKMAKNNKQKQALTPPQKRHGETLNSYRARVAKWSKKNAQQ